VTSYLLQPPSDSPTPATNSDAHLFPRCYPVDLQSLH